MAYNSSENSLQPRKLRKPGVTILKEIVKSIKLDEKLIHENNQILREFLATFIEEMKNKDELFRLLFQKFHFTGSFYSDLRISMPDEFDINLVLNLPFKPNEIEILYHPQVPSYATYRLINPSIAALNHAKLVRLLFNSNGYLLLEGVRNWIQSVVDKARQTYKVPRNIVKIKPSCSGPARTLTLIKTKGIIDIDLVPVFACTLETKQPGIDHRVLNKLGRTLETFLVPKPYSPIGQAPVNANVILTLWRTHFPIAENELIHNIGCAKPVIKLLKLLRNEQNWKILASYYLKTIVMWMLLESYTGRSQQEVTDYWKEDKLDQRLIEAMLKLNEAVQARKIPYFFSKKHNLISKLSVAEAGNISGRLSSLIRNVQLDPQKFWNIMNVSPAFNFS